jgi:hypothetical protein
MDINQLEREYKWIKAAEAYKKTIRSRDDFSFLARIWSFLFRKEYWRYKFVVQLPTNLLLNEFWLPTLLEVRNALSP